MHLIEKSLDCLEETVGRIMGIIGNCEENSKTTDKISKESVYCPREYIKCHEWSVTINMNIKDTSGEV